MPKIIVKIPHLKAEKSAEGFVEYIAKRDGVDKSLSRQVVVLKPTDKQKKYINELLKLCPDAKESYEYEDYIENPTRQNASAFISVIAEQNPQLFADRETYINYIATRPNVEKNGEHGLFGAEDKTDLTKVKEDISNHDGVIWTPIISLRREDASRLGYDNAEMWQELIKSKQMELAETFGIPYEDFVWYAAFHNEGHHPHLHMVVYSENSKRGFIQEKDIEKVKSILANEIFKSDMYELYDAKTQAREKISDESRKKLNELADAIRTKDCSESEICGMLLSLAFKLKNIKGKKVYGYLPKGLKNEVDNIVKSLAEDDDIQNLYNEWCGIQRKIVGIYKDKDVELPNLWENKEFKKIRNAVVSEAVKLGNSRSFFDAEIDEVIQEGIDGFEREMNTEMYEDETDSETDPEIVENVSAEEQENTSDNLFEFDIPQAVCCDYRQPYKLARWLLYHEKIYEAAHRALEEQVRNGNVPAMFDLGKMYRDGLYVEADEHKANVLFKTALNGYIQLESKKPSDFYEYQIGRLYALQTDVRDYVKAREWFEKSAEQGNRYAMLSLGNLYYYGNGTEIDYEKAFDYLHKSAEKHCVHSYFRLGYMLRKGIGCEENIEKSDKWFGKMISHYSGCIGKEDAMNCYRLGQLYEKGWGYEKDIAKAMQYYVEACEANNANAEFALGRIYLMQGDEEQGDEYINRAVEHGNEYAGEWHRNWKEYQRNIHTQAAAQSAVNLFCRLASLIDDDAKQQIDGHNKTIVDSKERKELMKKKRRLGIKMG